MNYPEFEAEDRRLRILQVLYRHAQGGAANCRVIARALDSKGHKATVDQVRSDAQWLAEQGLATTETLGPREDQYTVVTISTRGRDIARGYVTHPGVADAHD